MRQSDLFVVLFPLGFCFLRLLRFFFLLFFFGSQRFAVVLVINNEGRVPYFRNEDGAMAHGEHGSFVLRFAIIFVRVLLLLFCIVPILRIALRRASLGDRSQLFLWFWRLFFRNRELFLLLPSQSPITILHPPTHEKEDDDDWLNRLPFLLQAVGEHRTSLRVFLPHP